MKQMLIMISFGVCLVMGLVTPTFAGEDQDNGERSLPDDEVPTLSQPEIIRKISNDFFNRMPQAAHDEDGTYEEPPLEDIPPEEEE